MVLARPRQFLYSRPMSLPDADPLLATITQTIVDQFAPERIVLFGSRGRGDNEPDSDYDLIIVLDTSLSRSDRDRPIREALRGADRAIDVIVYTPAEFERARCDVGALAYAGEVEGRVLYDRVPSRWPRRVREEPSGNREIPAVGAHPQSGSSAAHPSPF
jgi:predicted nucleotidyltransferase